MLRMDSDGPGASELFAFSMAGKAEVVIMIRSGQLRATGSTMRIVAVETENPAVIMFASQKVEPLLVMRLGMGLRVPPDAGLELVVIGQGLP